ncbi:peptidoglycan D,D-transpeptidase FtsI family protein [Gephyromycinifex aptenodytis]|uniref:peptidoglycan D,D-transpeptidase FtsI family protein n=1 Tax=Gephyromycinifex aptenodytis TaxID=2716227 RepID=UPI0014474240|nr:penicillin-binding protein 2 [Gephyromycinifex aptenodytis]
MRSARQEKRAGSPRAKTGSGSGSGSPRSGGGGGRGGSTSSPRLANPRRRVRALFVAILFVFTLFAAQLVRLQGIDAARVAEEARDLRSGLPTTVPAERGAILDRNGVPLATSVERRDVVIDQLAVAEYVVRQGRNRVKVGAEGAAKALAPILKLDESELRKELTGTARYGVIARGIEPVLWRQVDKLGIPGITSTVVPLRTYPGGAPVAPIVGWVGPTGDAENGTGGGLEYLHNSTLKGTPGETVREYSADNRAIPMGHADIIPAVPGTSMKLTIDNDLQWFAYDKIRDQVQKTDSTAGVVVVMDLQGRLRAVSEYPSFDPSNPETRTADRMRSSAFQDSFEPGSTAKVMSVGAALAEGVTTPTTVYDVPSTIERPDAGPKPFRDSHQHTDQRLTTAGIVATSSNVGTITIGEKLPPATLERYYRAFGLGEVSAVGFPGESAGMLKPANEWDGRTRYTVLFGQGLGVSAVQAAGVFQTIANNGLRVPASIVEGTISPDGTATPATPPTGIQVLPQQAAAEMNTMLRSVVTDAGTAHLAEIPGVAVAGKTGTSENIGVTAPKGHQPYTSSFIGYAPANAPQFIVAVVLKEPGEDHSIYGGALAGPVFRDVMSYALKASGVKPVPPTTERYPLTEEELREGVKTEPTDGVTPAPNGVTLPPIAVSSQPTGAAPSPSSR